MKADDAARVAAIRERAKKAKPGPWLFHSSSGRDSDGHCFEPAEWWVCDGKGKLLVRESEEHPASMGQRDMAFIASSREDVPWLCDALEAALRERDDALRREDEAVRSLAACVRDEEAEDDAVEQRAERAEAEVRELRATILEVKEAFGLVSRFVGKVGPSADSYVWDAIERVDAAVDKT